MYSFNKILSSAVLAGFLLFATAACVNLSHVCVQKDGIEVVRKGDAECLPFPSEEGNLAVAMGAGSFADASQGTGNVAIAIYGGWAAAADANNQTAIAIYDSEAHAYSLDGSAGGNIAIAISDSLAYATFGEGNAAVAANDSYAEATYDGGDSNVARAINSSRATVGLGSHNVAIANGGSCVAVEGEDRQAVTVVNGETYGSDC